MPMPPPLPSTEGRRDRHVFHEMGQIVRALEMKGPQTSDDLGDLVGAPFWEQDRYERALAHALSDVLVHRTAEGLISASG